MSIQYRFVPIYDNLNEDSEKVTGFYPKVVSRGTINKERMFEEISHGSSSLRSVDRINEIRAESIFVKGMHVRTSEVVNKKLKWARFERESEK